MLDRKEELRFKLADDVLFVMHKLEAAGYHAHIVGGSVRDLLLGKLPHDYDITTDATPEETEAVFSDFRIIETGLKHGTVTLIYNGEPYEITTYRTESTYSDNRHPDGVSFTRSLEEDLARRDFTVNAMCIDVHGGVVDIFGGVRDLATKKIRAVGNAEKRFNEDALRILRAIRFASTLGFTLDEETSRAVISCSHLLRNVSAERIYSELMKLLSGNGAYDILMNYRQVIATVIPELKNFKLPARESFFEDAEARLLSIFAKTLGSHAAEAFARTAQKLHTDGAIKKLAEAVFENLNEPTSTDVDLLLMMSRIGLEYTEKTVRVKIILGTEEIKALELLHGLCTDERPYKLSELAIGGTELLGLGFCGKEIGLALKKALGAVIKRKIKNNKEEIIEYLLKNE